MIKKSITYEAFDGTSVTADYYFHLTKAELVEMEMSSTGGMKEMLERIIATNDRKTLIETFKMIIGKAYGIRSEDGKTFEKNAYDREQFLCSEAYSELFMELITDANAATEFIKGVVPSSMSKQVNTALSGDDAVLTVVARKKTLDEYTELEQLTMSQADFDAIVGTNPKTWSPPVLQVAYKRMTSRSE
jgi:hypothetical protein